MINFYWHLRGCMLIACARHRQKPMIRRRNQGPAHQPEGESLAGKAGPVNSWKKHKQNLESDLETSKTTRSSSRSKTKWNLKECSLVIDKFERSRRTSVIEDNDRKWIIRQPCRRKPNYLIKLQPKDIMSATSAPAKLPRKQFARKSTGKLHLHSKTSRDVGEKSAKKLRLGNYDEPKKPPDKYSDSDREIKNGSGVESPTKIKEIVLSSESIVIDDLPELTQEVSTGSAISEIAVTPKTKITPKISEHNSLSTSSPVFVPECLTPTCQKDYPDKRSQSQESIKQNTECSDKVPSVKQDNSISSGSFNLPEADKVHERKSSNFSFLDSFKQSFRTKKDLPLSEETKKDSVPSAELAAATDAATPEEPVAVQDNIKVSNNTIDKLRKGLQCEKLKSIVHKVFKDRNEVINTSDHKASVKEGTPNEITLNSGVIVKENDHQNKEKELCNLNVEQNKVDNTSTIDISSNSIPPEFSNHNTESKDLSSAGGDNLTPPRPEEDDDDDVTIICTTCSKCHKEQRKQFQCSPAKLTLNVKSMQTSQVSDSNKENNSSDAPSNKQEILTPDISFKEDSACDIILPDVTKSAVDDSLTGKSTNALSEKVVIASDIGKKVTETDINEQTAITIAVNSQKVDLSDALPDASVSQPEVHAVEMESNAPSVDKELIPDSFTNPELISINTFDSKNITTLSHLEKVGKTVGRMEMNIPVDDISGALNKELLTTNQSSLSADEAVASEVAKLIKETSVHNLEQSGIIQTSVYSDSALSPDVTSSSESLIVIQSVHSVTPKLEAVGQPSLEVEKQQLPGDTILQKRSNDIYLDVKSPNATTKQLKLNITEISHARVDDTNLNTEQYISGKSCSDIVISQIDTVVNQSSNVISTETAPIASDYCRTDVTEKVNAAASAQKEPNQVTLEVEPSKNAEISSLSTVVTPIIKSVSTSAVIETKSIDSSPLVTPAVSQVELKCQPVEIISTTSETDPIPIETGTEAFQSASMNIDNKTLSEKPVESDPLVSDAMENVLIDNNDLSSKRPGSPSFTNNQLSKRLKLDTNGQDTLEEKTDSNSNTFDISAIMEHLPDGYTIVATKDLQSMLKKKAVDLLKPMVLQLEAVSKALETYRSMIKQKDVQHATEISKLKQDSQHQEQKPKMVSVESQYVDNFFINAIKAQSYPVLTSVKVRRWKTPPSSTPPAASDSSSAVNSSPPVTTTCPVPVCTKPLQTSPSPTSKPEVHKSVLSSSTNTAKSPISKLENMLSSTVPKYTSPCSFLQKSPNMKPPQVTPSPTQTTSTSPQKAGKKLSSPMAVIDLTQDSDEVNTSANAVAVTQQTSPKPSPGPPPKLIPNRKTVSQQLASKVPSPNVLPSLIQSPILRTNLQTSRTVNNLRMATATPSVRPNTPPQRVMHIPVSNAMGTRYIRPQHVSNSVAHQQLPEHRNTVHGSTMMTSNPVMAQATSAARALTAPSVVHQLLPQTKTASQGIPNSTHSRPPPQLITQSQTVRGFTSQYREPVRYPGVQPTSIENRPQPPPNVSISLMQQTPVQQHRLLHPQSRAAFPPPSYTVALNSQTAPQLQTRTDSVVLPQAVNSLMLQRHEPMQAQIVSNNPNRYPVVMGMPTPAQQLPVSQSTSSSAVNSQRHALQLHTTMVRLKETYDNLQNQQTEIVVKLQSKDISSARREELLKTLHEIQGNLHSTSQKQKQFQTEFTHIHGQSFRNQPPLQPGAAPVAATSQQTAASQLLALSHQANVQQRHQQFRMKHPAALPPQPVPAQLPLQAKLLLIPGKPVLNITRAPNGIVLSWTMVLQPGSAEIGFYHLFAYQEQEGPPSSSNWKKIGEVKALPLPMACTLTQFQHGSIYHFSVCAVDVFGRSGDFSENSSINLIN
ncbi:uncharacterized threonine-rich GPI-anchored glycoprotein PJ4664.02-like isoform X2 [Anneissia japonica]|uniref:uncharacterized threonine-rich GPI-anchored glycoprotein PJ4664.02-like isoform X2 n=1 Tax=Anneissia japonica TaxID=1529436 RepID=UPI001425804F|nr:uncharacterized threonine-rich GPI-anchored glycoprotein PJ4664.02-like isoform X2 [Anneissia japonica]